ncbi:hypothetical protein V8F33_003668 [Rhypophila sp. PSN 637]
MSQNAMRSIPGEVWYEILSHVSEDSVDITHFRCACTTFAVLGLPFALRKVTIYARTIAIWTILGLLLMTLSSPDMSNRSLLSLGVSHY